MNRLLIIDDDFALCQLLEALLTGEGFRVAAVQRGKDGYEAAVNGRFDLVILDRMLPDVDGIEVLRRIRQHSRVPVLMLTNKSGADDRINGLESGADDYVPKPFHPRELLARARAILRRGAGGQTLEPTLTIVVGDLNIEEKSRCVMCGGRPVALTFAEFEVLIALAAAPGRAVSRDALFRCALGRGYEPYDRSVDNLVWALRKALGPHGDGQERIRSVRGTGYVYAEAKT